MARSPTNRTPKPHSMHATPHGPSGGRVPSGIRVLVVCGLLKGPSESTRALAKRLFGRRAAIDFYVAGPRGRDCIVDVTRGAWHQACPGMPRKFDMAVFEPCGRAFRNSTVKKAYDVLVEGGLLVRPHPRRTIYPLHTPRNTDEIHDMQHLGFWFRESVFVRYDEFGVYVRSASLNPRVPRISKWRASGAPPHVTGISNNNLQARLHRLRNNSAPLTVGNLRRTRMGGIRNASLRDELLALLSSKNDMLAENWAWTLPPRLKQALHKYYFKKDSTARR